MLPALKLLYVSFTMVMVYPKNRSQNLGHEAVLTTFLSYGSVGGHRQGEIIQNLNTRTPFNPINVDDFAEAVARKLKET
jgi:hypothetical protein